jgi:hypothetical protein
MKIRYCTYKNPIAPLCSTVKLVKILRKRCYSCPNVFLAIIIHKIKRSSNMIGRSMIKY